MLRIDKSTTEEVLLNDCRKGRADAQTKLYERFAPRMLGICFRYIHDREEAEHVMIGGMIKVFEKLDQYQGGGSFEGWVRKIMVNESLMYIRKNKNMSLEVEVQKAESEPDYQSLEQTLEAADLLKLIAALPVGYCTVFNLYAIEGYNHQEIANLLGITENTSKSQLSRARKYLQARLFELETKELKKDSGNGK